MKEVRTLRIYQIISIVLVLFLYRIIFILPGGSNQTEMTPIKWAIVALALYSAMGGFWFQKKLLRAPKNPQAAAKSTPAGRWMVSNIIRIAYALSVSLWGMVLHFQGGPDSWAIIFNTLGLILLLIWRPGEIPLEDQVVKH